ncbi:MAG: hypothetical protein EZS28_028753 [Streblomastix strix]|uniref:Uncharacterized protein n=1 Tax=Streblomastix strix TaxID=222440 RepID=A0A5J4UZE4_9EUKA|nr:MAG: hypothetical protein EZS28_028753 [Streblomastix strix]
MVTDSQLLLLGFYIIDDDDDGDSDKDSYYCYSFRHPVSDSEVQWVRLSSPGKFCVGQNGFCSAILFKSSFYPTCWCYRLSGASVQGVWVAHV